MWPTSPICASAPVGLRPALNPNFTPRVWEGGALQAAEKLEGAVILRSSGDEESRIALKMRRARSFAEFTLSGQSEILRCAQNDSEWAQDDSI
jgi:hypothetical protein